VERLDAKKLETVEVTNSINLKVSNRFAAFETWMIMQISVGLGKY
jgi:hypothetical protein